MIRLFASDLDGTLLNADHKLDDIIEKMIQKVDNAGKYFCIATGRSMYEHHIDGFKSIQGHYYCISLNGAMITNKKGEIIYKQVLDPIFISEMLEEFPSVSFECLGIDKMYYRQSKEEVYKDYQKVVKWSKYHQSYEFERFHENTVFEFENEQVKNSEILKVNCKIEDKDTKERFKKFIEKNSTKVVDAPFMEDFFELTQVDVNKGNAIKVLARELGVLEDEIAVYGDGLNDLVMLSMFKHSYAPSNASDQVKKCANEVIGSYLDHAVSYHIESMLGDTND